MVCAIFNWGDLELITNLWRGLEGLKKKRKHTDRNTTLPPYQQSIINIVGDHESKTVSTSSVDRNVSCEKRHARQAWSDIILYHYTLGQIIACTVRVHFAANHNSGVVERSGKKSSHYSRKGFYTILLWIINANARHAFE